MMRRRHPLLFWLGMFWVLRQFTRRARYGGHGGFGGPGYGRFGGQHRHHGHHRHVDFV